MAEMSHWPATSQLAMICREKFRPAAFALAVISKMLTLHVANWHRAHRCPIGRFLSGSRRMPGRDRSRTQRPFLKCANSYLPDAQSVALPFGRLWP